MQTLQRVGYVSQRLGISTTVVSKMARRGDFEGVEVKLGKNRRFDPAALEEWIRKGGKPLPFGWANKPNATTRPMRKGQSRPAGEVV
jgi:predicted DNA-binding transcriptional regulator AlpA